MTSLMKGCWALRAHSLRHEHGGSELAHILTDAPGIRAAQDLGVRGFCRGNSPKRNRIDRTGGSRKNDRKPRYLHSRKDIIRLHLQWQKLGKGYRRYSEMEPSLSPWALLVSVQQQPKQRESRKRVARTSSDSLRGSRNSV